MSLLNFLNERWGDLVAFVILVLGVVLVLVARGETTIIRTGEMLIGAGLIGLKLRSSPGGPKNAG